MVGTLLPPLLGEPRGYNAIRQLCYTLTMLKGLGQIPVEVFHYTDRRVASDYRLCRPILIRFLTCDIAILLYICNGFVQRATCGWMNSA